MDGLTFVDVVFWVALVVVTNTAWAVIEYRAHKSPAGARAPITTDAMNPSTASAPAGSPPPRR